MIYRTRADSIMVHITHADTIRVCTLYKGYTDFMQTIRVHKPVYIYEGYTEFIQTIRVHKPVYTL